MKENSEKRAQQKSLTRGVAVSWIAQIIQVIAGFIVPRLIDRQLGPEVLGIWDFGWSTISYLGLLDVGIQSTGTRYVALYRAKGDLPGLNRVVSSVAMLRRGLGMVIFLVTFLLAWNVPLLIRNHSPELIFEARWLIVVLGTSLSVTFSQAFYGGIITGCHRWSLHHWISAISNLVSLAGMCLVLAAGKGLVFLALAHFGGELLGRIVRSVYAYRVCPGLDIRMRNATLATIKEIFHFGGKMFVGRFSGIVMNQTISIMIASWLGPAALAVFNRPRSLVRQALTFPQKYAIMQIPRASALSTRNNREEMQNLATSATRSGLYISLPILLFLAISGGPLLKLWMGETYANAGLMAILSLGFLAEIAYHPLNLILFGLNYHGRPGMALALGAAVSLVATGVTLGCGGHNLNVIALAFVLPWSIANGIYIPLYASMRLQIPFWDFLKSAWKVPILCTTPFSICLLAAHFTFPTKPVVSLVVALCAGGVTLAICYWIWVFPERWKAKVASLAEKALGFIGIGKTNNLELKGAESGE